MSCPAGSGFQPSGAVEAFHAIPHTDIDLQSSPDQFQPDNTQYWEAVIIWACVPILTCVCVLILMSIYFICVCCCCCCGGSRDWTRKPKVACGIVNLSIIAVLLGLIGASLWAELDIDQHMNDALDTLREVDNFFAQYTNDSSLYNAAQQNASLEALSDALSEQLPRPDTELNEVKFLTSANYELGEVYADIDSAVGPIRLNRILSEGDTAVEAFRNYVVIGYLCLVLVVLILLVVAIFCGCCIANPAFLIIMVVSLVVLTVTMWVAVGANLTLLIVVGDICNDPDMLIRNLTQNQANAVGQDLVNYYLVCNETCQASPFSQEIMRANTAFETIDLIEEKLQNYTTRSENRTILRPLLDRVERGFNGSRTGVTAISSCDTIHQLYLELLQALCGDSYDGFVVLFALACTLCVGMMVLVVTATFHTGFYCNYRKDYDGEAEAYNFPASSPGVWQSYGTNYNYSSSSYSRYREQPRPSGATEPPKYNDLQQPASGSQSTPLREISEPSH
jgi:hypothetical protein